jgi:hypothetical protein
MYLRNLSESLLRRWYLVIVGMCAVAALAALTYVHVPPTYQANANVVLLPPKTSVVEGGNPYLFLGGLSQALDVLTRSIDGDTTREGILGSRKDLDYAVEPDRTTAGPILVVQATGPTVKETLTVLGAVLNAVPVNLRQLQNGLQVSPSSQITSMTLTVDQKPTIVGKDRLRAVVGVAGIGAAGVCLLIGAVDGILLSRARRKDRTAESRPVATGPTHTRSPSASVDSTDVPGAATADHPAEQSAPDQSGATSPTDAPSFDEIVAPRQDVRSTAPEASRTQ